MKYFYARILDPEEVASSNFDYYYSKSDAKEDFVAIYGNRDYEGLNDYTEDFEKNLNNCYDDLDTTICSEEYSEEDKLKEVTSILNYYFKKYNKVELTELEMATLMDLCKELRNSTSSSVDDEIYAELAGIIYGEEFITGMLHGSMQSEWIKIIMPKRLESKKGYIEAVYFGTGTALAITEDAFEDAESALEAMYNGDCLDDYTDAYRIEDIRNFVAEWHGTKPEKVKILTREKDGSYKEN